MLLSYHFLTLWPELELKGVSAATGKNGQITHYWIEINDIVVDITGDQYNIIDDKELNSQIIKNRPYSAIHVAHKEKSYLYNLFKIREKEPLVCGFPTIGKDFIEDMELGYNQLFNRKEYDNS
ncbi:hypothetical protein F2181_26020 [Salmonella enterica]|nr:hypothetical protein [Salmonella enterica]